MALFGAICWGIAPVFGKVGLRGVNPVVGLAARTLITVLFVGGMVLACGGVRRIGDISTKGWYFLAAEAALATFAGDLAYYAAIKQGEVGMTALILAASPLLTLWAGWAFLGEHLSAVKLVGAALIVIGVMLIGINSVY